MNDKGFSLVTVLVLSLIIFVLGSTGAYIVMINIKSTTADIKYNLADKASNAGMLRAFDEINKAGAGGDDRTITGTIGNASYSSRIMFGGKNVWFVSSEGSLGNSRVVRTALFQGYYGVGLYTVRGRVNANLGARLSGCDRSVTPTCFVPAFIASGTINTSVTPRSCSADTGSNLGVFGEEPVLNIDQGDLSRIFFKVKCFNKHNDGSCNISLLDYLEYDYGRDPDVFTTFPHKFLSFRQESNGHGIPTVTIPPVSPLPSVPTVPPSCRFNSPTGGINLTSQFTTCDEIVLDRSPASPILGNGNRGGQKVKIYAQNYATTFNNASNFILYTTASTTVQNNSNNFELHTTGTNNITNASNFKMYIRGTTAVTATLTSANNFELYNNNQNLTVNLTTTSNFKMYTTGTTNLSDTINFGNIVSTNTINAAAGATINNSRIIIGFTHPFSSGTGDPNNPNNPNAPKNFVFQGNITIGNATADTNPNIIIARSLRFADNSSVRILNSLMYVYAYACPSCARNTDTSSLTACDNDTLWCGWYGSGITLNLGRDASGNPNPVLFISNNTTVRTDSPSGTVNIWGVWYGQDITYLRWYNTSSSDFRGFLIRNFPPDRALTINISSGFTMSFSKPIIDTVSRRYRFFREVECVRDPLTPQAQMIQTRMVNY